MDKNDARSLNHAEHAYLKVPQVTWYKHAGLRSLYIRMPILMLCATINGMTPHLQPKGTLRLEFSSREIRILTRRNKGTMAACSMASKPSTTGETVIFYPGKPVLKPAKDSVDRVSRFRPSFWVDSWLVHCDRQHWCLQRPLLL